MGKTVTYAALVLGFAAASQVQAQAKPEDLVKQRKAGMTMIAKYFGPIGAMVQGKVPYNADVVARNAGYLEVLAKMPWDGFQASTEGVKDTRAKPEAYRDTGKFKERADAMQDAIAKLAAAAKGGDEGAVKTAFGAVGKTCKGCHDDFRKD
jgi:cytochrome c556